MFIDLIIPVIRSLAKWYRRCAFSMDIRVFPKIRPVDLLRFQRSLARRITDEFTNAQHPLNMAGVSKCWQKSVIKLLPAAQLQSPML
jgi:hypothetical protein